MMTYRPRRAPRKYVQDAPDIVLSIHDAGVNGRERFSICLGGPFLDDVLVTKYQKLHVIHSSEYGSSYWGEIDARTRTQRLGKLISWHDLPLEVKNAVQARTAHI